MSDSDDSSDRSDTRTVYCDDPARRAQRAENGQRIHDAVIVVHDAHRAWLLDVSNDAAATKYRDALSSFAEHAKKESIG